jgi:ribosomal 50S subunit-recycling heat shock protein
MEGVMEIDLKEAISSRVVMVKEHLVIEMEEQEEVITIETIEEAIVEETKAQDQHIKDLETSLFSSEGCPTMPLRKILSTFVKTMTLGTNE